MVPQQPQAWNPSVCQFWGAAHLWRCWVLGNQLWVTDPSPSLHVSTNCNGCNKESQIGEMIPSSLREFLGCSQGERERAQPCPWGVTHPGIVSCLEGGGNMQRGVTGGPSHNSYNSHCLLSTHREPDALCIFSHFSMSVREVRLCHCILVCSTSWFDNKNLHLLSS